MKIKLRSFAAYKEENLYSEARLKFKTSPVLVAAVYPLAASSFFFSYRYWLIKNPRRINNTKQYGINGPRVEINRVRYKKKKSARSVSKKKK